MKKIIKLAIGVALTLILFYQQEVGVNLGILALFTWLTLFYSTKAKRKDVIFWMLSIGVFMASVSFSWYGDPFSFFGLLFSILVIGIRVQYPKMNFILYPIILGLNYVSFVFRIFFFKYWVPKRVTGNNFMKKLIAWVLIPAVFSLMFIFIYTAGSSVFNDFFLQFKFGFDFFQIVFLIAIGFFFFFNYWFMLIPKEVIRANYVLMDEFSWEKHKDLKPSFSFLDLNFERKSGIITLVLLNTLLLFFIIAYNYEQFFLTNQNGNLSSETHERVATIIFSITMAIVVIMFYFKSTFNFDKEAGMLRKLANVWILLNLLLILSALIKNAEYIGHYGLTYKRIGVYIFLLLSLTGIIFTYLKIKNKKTNAFLINRMLWIFYFTFVVASVINFSWVVTKYNITSNKNDDFLYLRSLEFNKRLLYNTYHDDDNWQAYFKEQGQMMERKKKKNILSSSLYHYFIDFKK